MHELIVVGFQGRHTAADVLDKLQRLSYDWTFDLADAVAAYRTGDGKLRVDQSVEPTTKEGAGWGALIGGMLGALVAAPFTGGMSVAAVAATLGFGALASGTAGAAIGATDANEWKEQFGVSDDFVREVGGMIQPGDSAVFAVIDAANPEQVAEQFRGYGGTILRTSLAPRVAARVQDTLRA